MTAKKACAPYCRIPEKRDFMDIEPEKSALDFYHNYDPMVGVGRLPSCCFSSSSSQSSPSCAVYSENGESDSIANRAWLLWLPLKQPLVSSRKQQRSLP
uniref:Uncharacterized protein n=1 Tax=Ditylenchus dipsaci TaxID=166011 RepID=A0A915CW40_9BILA